MIPVTELVARGVPVSLVNMLPQTCSCCGSGLELSETLQVLRCSNPYCPEVVACRLQRFLWSMGFEVMLPELTDLCSELSVSTVYDIFDADFQARVKEYTSGSSSQLGQILQGIVQRLSSVPVWFFVRMGYFEELSEFAFLILSDVDDLTAFYDDYIDSDFGEFQCFVLKRLGGESVEGSLDVLSLQLFSQFIKYRDDLLKGLALVPVGKFEKQCGILSVLDVDSTQLGRLLLAYNEQFGQKLFLYGIDWSFGKAPNLLWYPDKGNLYAPRVLQDIRDNYDGVPVVSRGDFLATVSDLFDMA